MDVTAIYLLYGVGVGSLAWEGLGALSARGIIPWRVPLISPVMRHSGRLWLFWPWLWGVLPGHWFFWIPAPQDAWAILLILTLALVTMDFWRRAHGDLPPKQAPFITFILGIVAGSACWAMGY